MTEDPAEEEARAALAGSYFGRQRMPPPTALAVIAWVAVALTVLVRVIHPPWWAQLAALPLIAAVPTVTLWGWLRFRNKARTTGPQPKEEK